MRVSTYIHIKSTMSIHRTPQTMTPAPRHTVLARRLIRYRSNRAEGSSQPSGVDWEVAHALEKLDDSNWLVRKAALYTLGELEPETLAQHADAVLAMLEDDNEYVIGEAMLTLGKLKPATFAKYAANVVANFRHPDWEVREDALRTLGRQPASIAKYAVDVLAKFGDQDSDVRKTAVQTLGKLDLATLAQHADALARMLDDANEVVIAAAKRVRARLHWMRLRAILRAEWLISHWRGYAFAPGRPGAKRARLHYESLIKGFGEHPTV